MDRQQLESAGARYPYLHVQGLYAVPAGCIWFVIGWSNLEDQPAPGWALVAGLLLSLAAVGAVTLYYRHAFGRVTPTRSRQVRYYVAFAAGFAVYVVADQVARTFLGRPPRQPVSTLLAAWALGSLVFYALIAGLRAHHVVIWGVALVAGCLPVWGVGVDRDAMAAFPIGVATIASGLLDHRLLLQTFRSYRSLRLERSDAGA